jgi:hypothetical protein
MASLMHLIEQNLRQAQALSASFPAAPTAEQQQRAGASGARAPLLAGAAAAQPQPQLQPQPQQSQEQQATGVIMAQVPLLLQFGPALARAVRQTQAFRLLAAAMLAYAALAGWRLLAPPVMLLLASDLAVVLTAAAVLPAKPPSGAGAGSGADAQGGEGDAKVPWRLRSFDMLALVPGLRELLHSLSGYRAVTGALSQDFAAYVVALGVLTAVNEAAPAWYVPRALGGAAA